MKRTLALLGILVAGLLLSTGCSSEPKEEPTPPPPASGPVAGGMMTPGGAPPVSQPAGSKQLTPQ